jgi:hypothetical protein
MDCTNSQTGEDEDVDFLPSLASSNDDVERTSVVDSNVSEGTKKLVSKSSGREWSLDL